MSKQACWVLLSVFVVACSGSEPGEQKENPKKEPTQTDNCGNDRVDAGESCDGDDLDGTACEDLGFTGGILGCRTSCTFDTSDCEDAIPTCGTDTVEEPELCDGEDLDGYDCESLGFGPGELRCNASCTDFDTSDCEEPSDDVCGDGIVGESEDCEDGVGDATCADVPGMIGGELGCDAETCKFDTSACFGCGDGVIQGAELCDTTTFPGESTACGDFYEGALGEVSCNESCYVDYSGCTVEGEPLPDMCAELEWYGDGYCDPCELLNGSPDTEDCAQCAADEVCVDYFSDINYAFTCEYLTGSRDPDCLVSCGDGVLDPDSELCDGADLGEGESVQTCDAWGYAGTGIACNSQCSLDFSGCVPPSCGNGTAEGFEECDGADLRELSCDQFEGYTGGTLGCTDSCTFDLEGTCEKPTCGDGIRSEGEACEGADLGTATCQSAGFAGGTLACKTDDSCSLDTSGCFGCGDDSALGLEVCDGETWSAWYSRSCADWGMGDGMVSCTESCTPDLSTCSEADFCAANGWYDDGWCDNCAALGGTIDSDCDNFCDEDGVCSEYYDTYTAAWTCTAATGQRDLDCGSCGDGVVDSGEFCDPAEGSTTSCEAYGYADTEEGGSAGCNDDCTPDLGACEPTECGDGKAEGWEECDTADLQGLECTDSEAFSGGTLKCNADCTFNTDECTAPSCGDGVINGEEACDTADLGGASCEELGYDGGTPTCTAECELSFDSCTLSGPYCGDGVVNGWEVCDGAAWGTFGGPQCRDFGFGLTGNVVCGWDCTLWSADLSQCEETDLCADLDWYGDGYCDACEYYGGQPDTADCDWCEDDFTCEDYYDAWLGLWTCGNADPGCFDYWGDGSVTDLEWCDDNGTAGNTSDDDYAGQTCQQYGFSGGSLGCSWDSALDFSGCTP